LRYGIVHFGTPAVPVTELLASYFTLIQWAIAIVALLILVSSLDDLFIDVIYWVRQAWRRWVVRRRHPPLPIEKLNAKPEQLFAIMVPAWQEAGVISQMLENTVSNLRYGRFVIFVGTYVNDAPTGAEVDAAARRIRNLQHVTVPHAGPTCKADCLNWLIQGIFDYEKRNRVEFAGIVLHDSEDIIHPLELKLFNFLVPRKDMVQLPVLSLEREWNEFVAGTYIDDFAEWHSKDLVVREALTQLVPCAGVSACFSRRALMALNEGTGNQPFNTETLTEDYDISFRLKQLGMSEVFVKFPVSYEVKRRRLFGLLPDRVETITSMIATREYFPSKFRAAMRQKARWLLGIAIQGWAQVGWPGTLAEKYLLFRDRKTVLTSLVTVVAYLLVLNYLVIWSVGAWRGEDLAGQVVQLDSWIGVLFAANLLLLLNRAVNRVYFVGANYGWEQGLMSLPRMVVGNVLNFAAASRAIRQWVAYLVNGKPILWDKTEHEFPSAEMLRTLRRNLGDLLMSWHAVEQAEIEAALMRQKQTGQRLGHILVAEGHISDDMLADAIAVQNGLQRTTLEMERVHGCRHLLPLRLVVMHQAVPVGLDDDGVLQLIATAPLGDQAEVDVLLHASQGFRLGIVTESEMTRALHALTSAELAAPSAALPVKNSRLLGDVLIDSGALRRDCLVDALQHYDPGAHGNLGHFLVQRALITQDQLDRALSMQGVTACTA
jgi:bacteriophage N4 adsorption protein B